MTGFRCFPIPQIFKTNPFAKSTKRRKTVCFAQLASVFWVSNTFAASAFVDWEAISGFFWLRLVVVIVAGLIGYLVYRWRLSGIKAHNRQLKAEIENREKVEKELDNRLIFESTLTEISQRCINLNLENATQLINASLQDVARFLETDCCAIYKISPDMQQLVREYIWYKPSFSEVMNSSVTIDIQKHPIFSEILDDAKPFVINDLNTLKLSLCNDGLFSTEVQSFFAVPLIDNNKKLGILIGATDKPSFGWSQNTINQSFIIARVFAMALLNIKRQLLSREREAYANILSRISTRFINMNSDVANEAIGQSLVELSEFLGAGRCSIYKINADEAFLERFFEWRKTDVPDFDDAGKWLLLNENQWYFQQIRTGEPFIFKPSIAARGDINWQMGTEPEIRSSIVIPMLIEEQLVGHIAFDFSVEKQMLGDLQQRYFKLVGEMFVNAVTRWQYQLEKEEQLAFERLLSEISTVFIKHDHSQVDQGIEIALEKLGNFCKVDRCTLFLASLDLKQPERVYQWAAPNVPDNYPVVSSIKISDLPQYIRKFKFGETVIISERNDIPETATEEIQLYEKLLAKSLFVIPLKIYSEIYGYFGLSTYFETRKWSKIWISRATLIAEIFANVVHRRRMEIAFKESTEFLGLAMVTAKMGTWTVDLINDKVFWSRGAFKLYGLPENGPVPSFEVFLEQIEPEFRDRIINRWDKIFNEKITSHSDEFRVIWPNGERHWIEDRVQVHYNKDGLPERVTGICLNIDKRKEDARTIQSGEQVIESLVKYVEIGLMLVSHDSNVIHYNDKALKLLDLTPEQLKGKEPYPAGWKLMYEDGRELMPDELPVRKVLESREPERNLALQIVHDKKPEPTWVLVNAVPQMDANGDIRHIIYSFSDITRRKEAEEFFKTERDRSEMYFQTAGSILVVQAMDGTVIKINRKGCEILKMSCEEIIGKNWFTHFISESYRKGARFLFDELVSSQLENIEYTEFALVNRIGEERLITCNSTVIRDPNGKIIGVLSSGEDITQRRHNEAELANYRYELEQLVEQRTDALEEAQKELLIKEKLATLGQLIAVVSHELRNPLGAVRSSFFVVKERTVGHELGIEKALVRAERNIVRCDRIIEELLDYTRRPQNYFQKTTVDRWLDSLLSEYVLPENVILVCDFSAGCSVNIDRERFHRCVTNVLDNACAAMASADAAIDKPGIHPDELFVSTHADGQSVTITITDSGCGIPQKQLEKIFEPLYSTKAFGIGLGLPIVKQIVESHSGTITINSITGKGTTVNISLPVYQNEKKENVGRKRIELP